MMKKMLIGLAALVLIVVVGVIVLVATVDVDHYKPQIQQAVHDKMDRTLTFDGKLSLSVFPTIAVALPRTTLSEHGSDAPFVSFDRARVSLAVVPLLSGRLEAGTASLYGLRATIDQRSDGTSNIDDLTGGPEPTAKAEPSAPSKGEVPQFDLGGIELIDAQVVYRDERSHNTVTVSKLNLRVGRIANRARTPVDLAATVTATEPPSSVDLTLKTTADLDLAGHAFGVEALDAHARGRTGADQFDVEVTAPKIALDPEHIAGEMVKLVASVSGAHQARAEMALQNVSGSGNRLSVDKMAGTVELESPALPQKSLKVSLDGAVSVDMRAQDIAARLGAHFDETNATARVNLVSFKAPRIGFDADVDRLNLDRYVPSEARSAKEGSAKEGPQTGSGSAPAAASAADPKVDLSALKSLNLTGEARIGALQVHNLKVSKIKVGVRAAGGRLDVAPLAASLYEGALNGTAGVDANANRVAANITLDGISIGPLVKDLMNKDLVDGHGTVKLNVTTAGATVGAMKRALGGSGSLALLDGAVHGINIAQKLRDVKSVLAGGSPQAQSANSAEKTDFSELTGSFSIKNGVASNNDLQAKSPLLRVTGAGNIDIGASTLDYTVQAAVVGTLEGQGGGELANLHGVTIPVHLSGPFAALSYQLDWGSLARQTAKNQATQQVKNLLANKLKQGSQSGSPNLGDALKNLLGK